MPFFQDRELPNITDKPIEFEFDPDTGLVSLVFFAGFSHPSEGEIEIRNRLMLTPKASEALLADLSKLEAVLSRAKGGKTKPHFLQ